MKFKLKALIAAMALVTSASAIAAGFTPPEPTIVDRLQLTRNHNGRFSEPNDWWRRITISGEVNVDFIYANRTKSAAFGRHQRHNSSDISLADSNMYFYARVNDWFDVHADVIADDINKTRHSSPHALFDQDHVRNFGMDLDEAYVTIADFRQSPFYGLAGREYVPYGYYVRHPVTAPVTQLLTQTNATAAQLGFVDISGFNGSVFAFRNKVPPVADALGRPVRHRIENGGAQIGYKYDQSDWGVMFDASWLGNIADVDYIEQGLIGFNKAVDGYSLVAQGHFMGFDAEGQYTAAAEHFAPADVCFDESCFGLSDDGARPRAWMIGLGYSFPVMQHNTRFGIDYQRTREAVDVGAFGLPKRRWEGTYTVNVLRNTDVSFVYNHDKDYDEEDGGTDRSTSMGIIRLSTKFA